MVDHATQAKAESFVKSQHDRARRMAERLFDIWVVTDLGMGSVMARPTISPDATPQKVVVLVGVRCLLGDEIIVMRIGGRLYTPGSIRSRVRVEDVHVSGVESVNGLTGEVLIDADDISDTSTSHKFVTSGDLANLANISGTNTGDQDLSGYVLSSSLSLVATSGDYNDLDNLPSLFDGDYNSLDNLPTLGTAAAANTTAFATAAQGNAADTAVQPGDLATVATSGSYDDLDDKPSIPAAQVSADWNVSSGVAQILNKPAIPDALTDLDTTVTGAQLNSMKSKVDGIENGAEVNVQADWAASSGDAFVANKPVPITATSGSAIHASTSTSATDYVGGTTLAVPSGEYRIHVFASFPMRRSVGSGDVWIRLRIGGTAGSERGWSLAGTGIEAGQWFTFAYAMNGQTFTTDGSGVLVEFGIRGGGTAGTTNLYQGTVFGTFTKIG